MKIMKKNKEIDKLLSELKSVQDEGWINEDIRKKLYNLKLISDKGKVYQIDKRNNVGIWIKFSNRNKENVGNKGYVMQLIWIKNRKMKNNEMNRWLNEMIEENGFDRFILVTVFKADKNR